MRTRLLGASLLLGLSAVSAASVAGAQGLEVVQVTRYGYVVTDTVDSAAPFDGRAPVNNTSGTFDYLAQLTAALDAINAPHPDYIASMQLDIDNSVVAFYLGLANDTTGIGIRNPLGGSSQVFDLNNIAGTSFRVTGYVYLNGLAYYNNPALQFTGQTLICTQEFGHRWGPVIQIPPFPAAATPDAGASEAGPEAGTDDASADATMDDATLDAGMDDAAPDTSPEASPDAQPADAADVPAPPRLAADYLLGRQRAHWTYFMNSGGSPMEGNVWMEIQPGVFRTNTPSFQFSQLDLYLMGLAPASSVDPFWVIANPDVMGQQDMFGHTIWRESPPEYGGRRVTIRGQRDTYTIQDVIRANGVRSPAYHAPGTADAGADGATAPDSGSTFPELDMRVAWILLVPRSRYVPGLGRQLDMAVQSCSEGFNRATSDRIHLAPVVAPMPDAGMEASVAMEAGTDAADASRDGFVFNFPSDVAGDGYRGDYRVGGGCGCHTTPAQGRASFSLALCAVGAALALRRRRSREV